MKRILTILIIFKTVIGFSQDTIRLTGNDSVLFERLIENDKKLDSLQNRMDSISIDSDSIYQSIDNTKHVESINFDYPELLRAKQSFEDLYSKYIASDNFPNQLPIDSIHKDMIIGFGNKFHPIYKIKMFHQGIDIPASKGKPVKSTISGVVETKSELRSGYGNYVIIKSENQIKILFAHLDTIIVNQGDEIRNGQIIGTTGNSGMSTGNHLHYEIYIENEFINPIFTIFNLLNENDLEIIYKRNTVTLD